MNRRRATVQVQNLDFGTNTQKRHRHSHLNENVQLKNAYSQFFEQYCSPTQEKQKIQLLSKSLKSLQNKYLNQTITQNGSSKHLSSRESRKDLKNNSFRISKHQSFSIQNQNVSRFSEHPYFKANRQSLSHEHNFEEARTYDFSQFQLTGQGSNSFKIFDGKGLQYKYKKQNHSKKMQASFKIKMQVIPHHKLKINRQNKQNEPHQAKRSISMSEPKSKQKENNRKIKYEVKRLWQIKAIELKRKQNQMVHKLIQKDVIPTVKKIKTTFFKISEDDQEKTQQTKTKKRRLRLSHYEKVLKQLEQAEPRYGLKQKAMSVTKIKMLQEEGKNLFKLY